jgi:hypothetical protein
VGLEGQQHRREIPVRRPLAAGGDDVTVTQVDAVEVADAERTWCTRRVGRELFHVEMALHAIDIDKRGTRVGQPSLLQQVGADPPSLLLDSSGKA